MQQSVFSLQLWSRFGRPSCIRDATAHAWMATLCLHPRLTTQSPVELAYPFPMPSFLSELHFACFGPHARPSVLCVWAANPVCGALPLSLLEPTAVDSAAQHHPDSDNRCHAEPTMGDHRNHSLQPVKVSRAREREKPRFVRNATSILGSFPSTTKSSNAVDEHSAPTARSRHPHRRPHGSPDPTCAAELRQS